MGVNFEVLLEQFGEQLRELFENLIGILWEHDGNTLGTRGNFKKKIKSHPTPPQKDNNWTPCECMLILLIGCMKTFIFTIVCHHFWLLAFLANAMNCVGERGEDIVQ
jgi:hypothetical protein